MTKRSNHDSENYFSQKKRIVKQGKETTEEGSDHPYERFSQDICM